MSLRQYLGFDPSGSHQLPIAGSDGDQCSLTLRTWRIFFEIIYSFGGSRILDCDRSVVLPPANGEHKVFDPIVHSLTLCFLR